MSITIRLNFMRALIQLLQYYQSQHCILLSAFECWWPFDQESVDPFKMVFRTEYHIESNSLVIQTGCHIGINTMIDRLLSRLDK